MAIKFYRMLKILALLQLVLVAIFSLTSTPVFAADPAPTPAPAPTNKIPATPTTTGGNTESNPSTGSKTGTKGSSVLVLNDCPGNTTSLTVASLLKPTSFVPLVPNACSGGTDGPEALSLKAIPVIIVRIYGLLASLVFFLTGFNLIFASVRYSYGAFDEAQSKNAINSIQESATSVGLVLVAHLIVSTIFSGIFKIPLNTDASYIQSFFN